MARNFLILIILCCSSFFLRFDVNGAEVSKTSVPSRKSKRAIEDSSRNFSNKNDLIQHSPLDSIESNEISSSDGKLGSLQPVSIAKRAPSGFTGMRGKKQFEYTDISPNDLNWSFDEDYPYDDIRTKKAPLGFNGVRGKKWNQPEYDSGLLDQLLHRLYEESNEEQDMYRSSSLPLYPFGYSESVDWKNSLDKRAPVGFTGMRGKRPLSFPFDGGKRNPNAFFGVRGKRDFKRSAIEQYNSGYFGLRGKKQPGFLGFRNKFVGVRGKKDVSATELHRLESQMIDSPVSNYRSSARYFINPLEYLTLKRTPNGFLGMRGKRHVNTDAADQNGLQSV